MKRLPLSETHPFLATQAIGWDPTKYSKGSSEKMLWFCGTGEGHVFTMGISDRVRGSNCNICAGKVVLKGFNDFASKFPELAKQAKGWDPSTVIAGSAKKMLWHCEAGGGHDYETSPLSRSIGHGCHYCSGFKVLAGFNDLATTFPKIASEALGWNPSKIMPGSAKKLLWHCDAGGGHDYVMAVTERTQGSNCNICAGKVVLKGFNDFASKFPELAKQAKGWDPSTVTTQSKKKYLWHCEAGGGHDYVTSPQSRAIGHGCVYCSGQAVLAGFNDFASRYPELANQADGWDPEKIVFGSGRLLPWKCDLKHSFKQRPVDRIAGNGCKYCGNQALLVGFNDLASKYPEIAKQALEWDPTQVLTGSHKIYNWQCPNNAEHQWKATVGSRVFGSGCPSCAVGGFDPNEPAWLYFLSHPDWELLQIGISNVPKDRLASHRSSGWEVLELRGSMPGDVTYRWEQDILNAIKKRGVKLGPDHIAGKFSGYTESWVKKDLPAKSLSELMELVHNDEG